MWHVLRYDRQYGAFGGESPISFQAIDRYARRYGYVGELFDVALSLVTALDSEYLEILGEEMKREREEKRHATP